MGSCQSKKQPVPKKRGGQAPTTKGKQDPPKSLVSANPEKPQKKPPKESAKVEEDNEESKQVKTPKETKQISKSPSFKYDKNAPWNEDAEEYTKDFLEGCFNGKTESILKLIKQHKIQDIAFMKGFEGRITLNQEKSPKTYELSTWNPLLLAIAQKHAPLVAELFSKIPHFHKINCIAKPYDLESQKKKIFHHDKRLKRECFALKLAILNQDIAMLKFLWNDMRSLWNLGHVVLCIRMLMKYDWEVGLRIFLGSTTTKVIFMSINNYIDFIDTVDLLKIEIEQYEQLNQELSEKFKDYFFSRPFLIFNFFIIIVSQENEDQYDMEKIMQCLDVLSQDDIQLKHSDIHEIFTLLGETEQNMEIKNEYLKKFENKDDEIVALQEKLEHAFEDQKASDSEQYLDILDELDLFAFSDLKVRGERTNALVEALNRGFETIIDYALKEGFVNIRATLKKNNIYEIENDISQFTVSFFLNHSERPPLFKKIYNYLIDLLQLSNFLELLDFAYSNENMEIFNFLFNDAKFKSLFESSLEFQKILFTKELVDMAQDSDEITELLQKEPYAKYYEDISNNHNNGDNYCKLTLAYLQQVQTEKIEYSKMSDASRDSFLKGKEDRLAQLQRMTVNTTKQKFPVSPNHQQEEVKSHSIISTNLKNQTMSSTKDRAFGKASAAVAMNEDTFAAINLKKQSSSNNNPKFLGAGADKSGDQSGKKEYNDTEDELKDIIEEEEYLINQSRQNIMKKAKPEGLSNEYSNSNNYELSLRTREAFHNLSTEILDCIKTNNVNKLKFLLRKYDIKNVQSIKNFDCDQVKVVGRDYEYDPVQKRESLPEAYYDASLWNPVLFAIYFQKTEIVRILCEDFTVNFILSLRLPPVNEFTEYIIPGHKQTPGWAGQSTRGKVESITAGQMSDLNADTNYYGFGTTTRQPFIDIQLNYNPSDARIECFGLELAIRNKDIQTMKYLWDDQIHKWEDRHFAFVFDKILQEHWDVGLGLLFKAKTSHIIFKSLSPEDKDNFLVAKIIDKITDTEFWGNKNSPIQVTRQQEQIVVTELSYEPYGSYSVLKFPSLFQNYDLLEEAIKKVTFDDIHDFVMARKENVNHFEIYVTEYQKQNAFYNKPKVAGILLNLLKKAQQIRTQGRKMPTNPEKIVQLIKLGDARSLKQYFQQDDNNQLLDMLNQLTGYEDKDYSKMFQNHIKYVPSDDIMRLLIGDNTTIDWNPLIFAIFYQKQEIVEFLVDNQLVYVRSCLTKPFQIEMEDEADFEEEEKFVQEKTEIFIIVLCIMLHNKEILRYIWKRNSFMWNEIHLVLLTNYILESQWVDGLKALLALENTRQIFNAMNLYEKEKYLKFCDRSVSKVNTIFLKDFRYQMSFDPYNIYYLPILATPDDLHSWEKELSKELFMKQCQQNFDERSYILMSKFNNHYINEFISTAMTADSEVLLSFAKKLRRYTEQGIK